MEDGFSGKNRDIWTKIGEVYYFLGDLKMCSFWFGKVAGIVNNSESQRASGFGSVGFGGVNILGKAGNYRQRYIYGVLSLCKRLEEQKSGWTDRTSFFSELDLFGEPDEEYIYSNNGADWIESTFQFELSIARELGVDLEVEKLIESKKLSLRLQEQATQRFLETTRKLQSMRQEQNRDTVSLKIDVDSLNIWNNFMESLISVQKIAKVYGKLNGDQLQKNLAKIKNHHLLKHHREGFDITNAKINIEIDTQSLISQIQHLRDQLGEDMTALGRNSAKISLQKLGQEDQDGDMISAKKSKKKEIVPMVKKIKYGEMNLRRPKEEIASVEIKESDTYNSSGMQNTFGDIFNKIQGHFLNEDHVKFLKKEEMSVFLSERRLIQESENLDNKYFSSNPNHNEDYALFDPLDQTMGKKFAQLMKEGKISSEKTFQPQTDHIDLLEEAANKELSDDIEESECESEVKKKDGHAAIEKLIHNLQEEDLLQFNNQKIKQTAIFADEYLKLSELSELRSKLLALQDFQNFLKKLCDLNGGIQEENTSRINIPSILYSELCCLVIKHFYAQKPRNISLSGLKFEMTQFLGPHPLIQNKNLNLNSVLKRLVSRFRKIFQDQLSYDVYLTLSEIIGEEVIKIEIQAKKEQKGTQGSDQKEDKYKLFELREEHLEEYKKYFQQAFKDFISYLPQLCDDPAVGFNIETSGIKMEDKASISLSKLRFEIQLVMMPMLLNSHSFDEAKSSLFCRSMILNLK